MKRIANPPDASSLMETARSFGNYDLAAALADIIDNSITAGCRRVDISCSYLEAGRIEVRIRDDGCGMVRGELIRAMCPASSHPAERRAVDDLGRFGWGLKSASFSQCRMLTVISKAADQITAARWNLDDIGDWQMDLMEGAEADALLLAPFASATGTELIWSNCDRLSENGTLTHQQFTESVFRARRRLSQIFHRYLASDGSRGPRLRIFLNNSALEQLDPFCQSHPATIASAEEPIDVPLHGEMHRVTLQSYVLPHYSKLNDREYEEFGGEEGYVRNQGFYVYRNERLIISGTWFGLARYGELSKLVRVRIDIPNSLDEIWKITVDKSDAQLPSQLRTRMKELVEKFRSTSQRVHRSKGARIGDTGKIQIWQRHARTGVIRYSLNQQHPLMEALRERLDDEQDALLCAYLQMAQSHIPADAIARPASSTEDNVQRSFLSREEVLGFLASALPGLMAATNSKQRLLDLLRGTEPFASNWNVTEDEINRMFPHG